MCHPTGTLHSIEKFSSSRSTSASQHSSKAKHTWDSCNSCFPSDPLWPWYSSMSWLTLGPFFSFAAQKSRSTWISLRNSSCTQTGKESHCIKYITCIWTIEKYIILMFKFNHGSLWFSDENQRRLIWSLLITALIL